MFAATGKICRYAVGFLKFWSEVGELLQHALFSGGEILPPDCDQRGQGQHMPAQRVSLGAM